MKGYIANIEQLSLENENFRKVLYTDTRVQLVVMALKAGEDIGYFFINIVYKFFNNFFIAFIQVCLKFIYQFLVTQSNLFPFINSA